MREHNKKNPVLYQFLVFGDKIPINSYRDKKCGRGQRVDDNIHYGDQQRLTPSDPDTWLSLSPAGHRSLDAHNNSPSGTKAFLTSASQLLIDQLEENLWLVEMQKIEGVCVSVCASGSGHGHLWTLMLGVRVAQ